MKTVGSYEMKAKLAEILREVETGETIIVTRNGHAVARISPIHSDVSADPRAAMSRLLASTATLGGFSVREMRDAGRRR